MVWSKIIWYKHIELDVVLPLKLAESANICHRGPCESIEQHCPQQSQNFWNLEQVQSGIYSIERSRVERVWKIAVGNTGEYGEIGLCSEAQVTRTASQEVSWDGQIVKCWIRGIGECWCQLSPVWGCQVKWGFFYAIAKWGEKGFKWFRQGEESCRRRKSKERNWSDP